MPLERLDCFINASSRADAGGRGLFAASDYAAVRDFFDARPELQPTPLKRLPALAARLGIGDLVVKDESERFGLNSFKIVGVRFASARLVERWQGTKPALACATAGNHGRAVARAARDLGLAATIFVPAGTRQVRIEAIASEGADVVVFEGTYDEAVREVAARAERHGWQIVSDTGWPGYDEIPGSIMLGYTHIFDEVAAELGPDLAPDIVIVQAGVGGLACAALSWFQFHRGLARPFVIAAEPLDAACLQASARAGSPTTLTGPLDTTMEGLRCAEVSTTAWPTIARGMDAFVAVSDQAAVDAINRLARPLERDPSVHAGPSGACGLAALTELLRLPQGEPVREAAGLNRQARVLIVVTEGP